MNARIASDAVMGALKGVVGGVIGGAGSATVATMLMSLDPFHPWGPDEIGRMICVAVPPCMVAGGWIGGISGAFPLLRFIGSAINRYADRLLARTAARQSFRVGGR
ncbi:hypothetical protein [Paracraurococcus lichenis]|uniref:Uncharacterized protein n=1 Tax=Paracraurococcus lichenis TaxID=3064888 RepID=A0ABT9E818_9PROT|nr:hypothetical protein [Paracraurococcus sp. LOR1-02]MDO9712352.1 hypothetical protein [Paracraurococcus sp. LOR1-02]